MPPRLAPLLALAIACAEAPREGPPPALTVTEVRRTPPTSVIAEEELADLEWGSDSTLAAVVERGTSVALVRWDGTLHRVVARRGDGPGEVRMVFALARPGDALLALDAHRFRILTWSVEGELRSDLGYTPALATGAWATERGVALKTDGGFMSGAVHFDLLAPEGDSTRRVRRLVLANTLRNADSTCSYCPSAVAPDGTIASSTSDTSYRILRWRADGTPLPSIERPEHAAVRRTPREVDSIAQVYEEVLEMLASRGRATPQNVARFRESARQQAYKRRFAGRGLVYDERGRLWVQLAVADGAPAAVDVFDRRGRLLGTVSLPDGTILRRARGDRLLTSITDEEGVLTVIEYRVEMRRR